MRKWLFLCVAVMCCLCPMRTFAAEGSIRIVMPRAMEGQEIFCKQGEEELATATVDSGGRVTFSGLSAGDYVIEIPSTEEYTFEDLKIRLPMWQEEEHQMVFDVEAIPKYTQNITKEMPPSTGDILDGNMYMGLGVISFIIVAIMIYKDTEKSCYSCRIGFRGCKTID